MNMKNYISCISALSTRIHRNSTDIDEELFLLKEFYAQPQTDITETQIDMTRKGISILLNSIQNMEDYKKLFAVQYELINVYIAIEGDAIQEGPYTFFYFIFKSPNYAIDVLHCAYELFSHFGENAHKILQYLFHLGTYVISLNQDYENMIKTANFMLFFIKRTQNFLSGFNQIKSQLSSQVLPFPISIKNILPTDGDMHCGGKIPYYILAHSGEKFVYKPRDMRTDLLVAQTLGFFNNLLEERFRLPIFEIRLLNDNTGMMKFVPHAENMTQEQAHSYFLKFGVLMCFINLFGIEDLHYENIMATENGPVMIDLECAFNPICIKKESINRSSINLIRERFKERKMENATFTVDGNFYPLSHWANEIIEGFSTAAACFGANQDIFVQHYFTLLQQPLFCRIVPIGTGDFYRYMHQALFSDKQMIGGMLQLIFSGIFDFFKNNWNVGKDFVDSDFVCRSIYQNFFYGDVPFLQLNMQIVGGDVYYTLYVNGEPVSKIITYPLAVLESEFRTQIAWLRKEDTQELLVRFIMM